MKNTYVAIMAGGVGSRFWPMSREVRPKQFLDMLDNGESLLEMTFKRFAQLVPEENIYIVTNQLYAQPIAEMFPQISSDQILAEPSRRNTAPCVAYVSYKVFQKNPEANLIVAPSDHLIKDEVSFGAIMQKGVDFVSENNSLLTLGIRPEWANTGYGYINFLQEEVSPGIHKVKTFTEKPDKELAKHFLQSGDYLWNSGMFLWSVEAIVSAFRTLMPEMADLFDDRLDKFNSAEEDKAIEVIYSQCRNISIDYGIMEKAENTFVVPASFGWCDLGTWSSLWDESDKDDKSNAVLGANTSLYDAKGNMVVSSSNKLVILQGLEDYIVIDTDDVLLVCKKEEEQRIKAFNADARKDLGDKFV